MITTSWSEQALCEVTDFSPAGATQISYTNWLYFVKYLIYM